MFGERLKELRKKNNLTQLDIANMLGVTYSAVSSWEVGKAQPDYDILIKLAEYFNVTTDYLLDFNQEDQNKMDRLKNALQENGIEDLEKAIQIVDLLKEKKDNQN